MYLNSYRLQKYRRLRDVRVEFVQRSDPRPR